MVTYEDFDILIGPAVNGHHQVTVTQSKAGKGGGVTFPESLLALLSGEIDDPDSADAGAERGRLRDSSQPSAPKVLTPEEKGRHLFKSLFADNVLDLFRQSIGSSGSAGKRLRVRLQFDLDDPTIARIAELPWELLYDTKQRTFLVQSSDITVVRGLSTLKSGTTTDMKPITGPIRVLLAMADPERTLNLKAESAKIMKELDALVERQASATGVRREIEAEFLEDATFAQLEEKLDKEDFHIIHFMGHGDFDAAHQGQLRFNDEWRSAKDLALVLRNEKNTRLVTLNACRTAESSGAPGVDPFAGVAQALVNAGIPAVIAMQFPVSDKAAIAFSSRLYSELGAGKSIEEAVDAGRRAIVGQSKGIEWATPVLFLQETVSFEMAARPVPAAAAPTADVPWGPAADGVFKVFLASTIGKMTSFRKKTEDGLKELPMVRVATLGPTPDDPNGVDAYRAAIKGLTASADLCVHILGDSPGDPYDDDPLHTYPIEQLTAALESGRPVMVIAPQDARAKIEAAPGYGSFVEALKGKYVGPDGAAHANPHQFELAFLEDKGQIGVSVAEKVKRMQTATSAAPPFSAFVDAYSIDQDFAFELEKFLSGQAIKVTRTSLQSPEDFDIEIGKFPVYIVVQGHADTNWVEKRFEAAHKAAVSNSARTLVGMYYAVPGPDGTRFVGGFSNPLYKRAEAVTLMKKLESGLA